MGATPKQRISRKRRGDRRSQQHLKPMQLVECPQCHNPRQPHHVCPICGANRNLIDCGHEEEQSDSRWEALRDLDLADFPADRNMN